MRQVFKYTLIVLAVVSAVVLLYQFRVVVLLLVISLAITAGSRPMIDYLGKLRVPGFLAQLLALVLVLGVVVGFIWLAGPQLTAELQRLTNYLLIQYSSAYQVWEAGEAWQQMAVNRLPEPGNLANYFLGEGGELLLPAAINVTQSVAGFFSRLFVVVAFSLYWAQDQEHFTRLWLSLLPAHRRIPIRNGWQAVERAVGRYLRQELALGVTAGVLLGIGYALLGLPYPAALALLAFLGWFVPLLGFAVILIPVYLTAASFGWVMVALAVAMTLVVLMGLKYWVEPKYLQPVHYSNFLIVFWVVVLGSFLGLGGYLAGPVVAVASQTIWGQYLQYRLRPERVEIQLAVLRERYEAAFTQYSQIKADHPAPQLGSIFDRLEHSLNQTEKLAEDRFPGT